MIPYLFGEHLSYPLYPSTYFFFLLLFSTIRPQKKKKEKIFHKYLLVQPDCLFMSQTLLHLKDTNIEDNKSPINIQSNASNSFQTLPCPRFPTFQLIVPWLKVKFWKKVDAF